MHGYPLVPQQLSTISKFAYVLQPATLRTSKYLVRNGLITGSQVEPQDVLAVDQNKNRLLKGVRQLVDL